MLHKNKTTNIKQISIHSKIIIIIYYIMFFKKFKTNNNKMRIKKFVYLIKILFYFILF